MKKRGQYKNQLRALSAIDQYFKDNPNAKIRDALDQEELLNTKQNCRLFGEYVTQTPERFWEMLSIIIIIEDDDLESIPKKYPFIVSEIIGSKEELIIDYFFSPRGLEEFEFLNFLFKIIDRDYIDNTLAGYFGKIMKAIIDKRGFHLWQYLTYPQKESQNVLEDFIKHLDVHHIADILFNLIRFDTVRQENGDVYLYQRSELLLRIIYYMQNKNYDNLVVENVCYILRNILTEISDNEEKEIFIQQIMNSSLQYNTFFISKSSDLVDLFIVLLDYTQQEHKPIQNRIIYNYTLLQELSYYLVDLLKTQLNLSQFQTTYGINQEPLGQFKLKLIEFYLKVLKLNDLQLINCFQHSYVCLAIMQLIQKHEFNNKIQNLFLEIIQLVMKNQEYNEIKQAYLEANVLGFLEELNSQYKYQVGLIKKQITKGFQGMANQLSYVLKDDFQEEKWQIYINRQQTIFQNENQYLLGQNPNYINENEEEINNQIVQSMTLSSDQNTIRQSFNQNVEQDQQNTENQQQQQKTQSDEEQIQQSTENTNYSVIAQDQPTNIEQEYPRSDDQFIPLDSETNPDISDRDMIDFNRKHQIKKEKAETMQFNRRNSMMGLSKRENKEEIKPKRKLSDHLYSYEAPQTQYSPIKQFNQLEIPNQKK
ncbi:unnamed protein product [Paramecium sonneborni]|uniref:Uncharacterized protein n=1 Tax=Paramecium sonneborni TaxID=65129 RepID=A0A8S1PPA2_9CILI|nr:unnamed protein product [Paramecium sonneborni]